jgi:hypothetical protein
MPLSDRTKRLLDWWVLHISSTKNKSEETKENVERINSTSHSDASVRMGTSTIGQGVK